MLLYRKISSGLCLFRIRHSRVHDRVPEKYIEDKSMKFEKINENQIRCTLTAADLHELNLEIRELAYSNDKTRSFFRAMMLRARQECGFDAENSPLMIEAIPLKSDGILLIVTKVDDPEELDTRFSRFTQSESSEQKAQEPVIAGADELIELLKNVREKFNGKASQKEDAKGKKHQSVSPAGGSDLIRLYTFSSLDTVIKASGAVGQSYNGINSLYKDNQQGIYLLTIHKSGHTPEEFNKTCNILSEYGRSDACSAVTEAHLNEHARCIIRKRALQNLCSLA